MTSVASPIKDFGSIHSSDARSFVSITSVERQVMQYQADIERFATPALARQRAVVDESKQDEQATLAVCAKLEKAISRRLSLQDAEFTKKRQPSTTSLGLASPLAPQQQTNLPVAEVRK